MLFYVSGTSSGAARVEDTVKDFWATRPRRPRRGRKIAGVATGIANRYRIDPVLMRVSFVVGAIFGGAGVLLYLLGWLFLPEQDDEVSPAESLFGKGRSTTSTGFTILLGIMLVPVVGWFFDGAFTGEFSSWMSLLVMVGLLFLLHQSRGHVTPVTPAPTGQQPTAAAPTMPTPPPSMATQLYESMAWQPPQPTMPLPAEPPAGAPVDMPPPVPEERTTPPAWDPLGAAPFAWDLPEPTQPEPEPEPPVKRRKPKVGTATLGITMVAVAGLAIASSEASGGWIDAQHIVGVALAIVGLGLVFGAFARAGRGLIALAVPLSVVGLGLTVVDPTGYHGVGDLDVRPTSIAAVDPFYQRSVGDVQVDLTGLPATGEVVTSARADLGNVTVIVPRDADVTYSCEVSAGNAECLDTEMAGMDKEIIEHTDFGADGPGGLKINLNASVGTGNVEVQRG